MPGIQCKEPGACFPCENISAHIRFSHRLVNKKSVFPHGPNGMIQIFGV